MVPTRWWAAAGVLACVTAAACAGGAATEPERGQGPSPSPAVFAAPAPDRSAFIAAVDGLAAEALQGGPIAGLSIAVFDHDKAILAKGYGSADVEGGVAATADTSYPIAS